MAFPLDLLPPVPNLNGNTKESLQEKLTALIHAISNVEEAIVDCHDCWHGRNFQTLEGGDIIRSLAEGAWRLRMIAMSEMHASIIELMMKIENGVSPIAEEVEDMAAAHGIVVVTIGSFPVGVAANPDGQDTDIITTVGQDMDAAARTVGKAMEGGDDEDKT